MAHRPGPWPGRGARVDRAALAGIMYVLRTGAAWRDVPAETVGCSGVTAWRRLRDWTEAGVWPRLHCALRAVSPSPVDRARPGSKHHLIVDRHGTPLAVTLTGGNRHDVTQLLPLLDAVPPIRGLRGRPRRKPRRLYADRGYDFDKYRRLPWKRGMKPLIARRGVAHGSGLGKVRGVVERAFAWLHQFKRLRIR